MQIIEGAMTITLGVLSIYFVIDFPEKNNFLTEAETNLILRRIEADRGDSVPDEITAARVWLHLLDWKIWVFGGYFLPGAVFASLRPDCFWTDKVLCLWHKGWPLTL